jgi:threonine aldolase
MIDLRSDTVTKPTKEMLEAMFSAEVGDDVFGEDPTVNALEEKVAEMFGKEAAIYCASGTMTNQVAVNVHTRPGDEVILHKFSHIYYYEGGAMMKNSGTSVCLLDGPRGMISAADILGHINPPDDIHRPLSTLVEVENTMNKGGGAIYPFGVLEEISSVCRQKGLKLHLDGARLFNAIVETGKAPGDFGKLFDSVSICLSKGLGAPVGSVLTGDKDFITRARRVRKTFGGAMRQAGYLAAAGIYALDHNIGRLKEDHERAKHLGEVLSALPFVASVMPVDSNIIIFTLAGGKSASAFTRLLQDNDICAFPFSKDSVRFVTHVNFTEEMLELTVKKLISLQNF